MHPTELTAKISQLIASGKHADAMAVVRAETVRATRDYFMRLLVLEDQPGEPPSAKLEVFDWKDIQLFLQEPPTQQHNPGGPLFESIKLDTKDAIEAKDATRLLGNLLLIYKAVRSA